MKTLTNLGPAIIVAAVVCGPGSILSASKTGAQFGYSMIWVLVVAVILMIACSILSSKIGLTLDGTPCDEIANHLGRKSAFIVGLTVFLITAGFQTSNNQAIVAVLSPVIENSNHLPFRKFFSFGCIVILNTFLILIVYKSKSLYRPIERTMKLLIGIMILAFLMNLIASKPSLAKIVKGISPSMPSHGISLPIFALIATTFSIAGAFYQSYLVRDKGWNVKNINQSTKDSLIGIITLGLITLIIMLTSAENLFGKDIQLISLNDLSKQLENLFGQWSSVVFTIGIFAGALSSFLINAMIGGRILADGCGIGENINSPWSKHFTCVVLVSGLFGSILFSKAGPFSESSIDPIIIAQASTILGAPMLAAALLFLGFKAKKKNNETSYFLLSLVFLGFLVTLALAWRTSLGLIEKLS